MDNEIGNILDDISKESRWADTIVSFIPEDIKPSDESFDLMYEATFSAKHLNDGRLIASRMFIVLENLPLLENTTIRVYRKAIGYFSPFPSFHVQLLMCLVLNWSKLGIRTYLIMRSLH